MPVAAIQGDVILTNPATHSPCDPPPPASPIPVVILLSLQQKVVFGIIPFAVTGSALTPHEYKPDSSCVPHTVLLGGLLTGPGSTKVTMGGFPANRLLDLADGPDGTITGPGAIKVIIGG
jgi:hypothetical protein